MSEANGHDIGAVYQLLATVARDLREFRGEADRRFADLKRDITGLGRAVADTQHGIASVREAVTGYHASVLGHGILISELEDRVRRLERHLNLPPVAAE